MALQCLILDLFILKDITAVGKDSDILDIHCSQLLTDLQSTVNNIPSVTDHEHSIASIRGLTICIVEYSII